MTLKVLREKLAMNYHPVKRLKNPLVQHLVLPAHRGPMAYRDPLELLDLLVNADLLGGADHRANQDRKAGLGCREKSVDLVLPALLVSEDHLAQKVLKEIEEPPDLLDPLVQPDPKGPQANLDLPEKEVKQVYPVNKVNLENEVYLVTLLLSTDPLDPQVNVEVTETTDLPDFRANPVQKEKPVTRDPMDDLGETVRMESEAPKVTLVNLDPLVILVV